MKTKKIQALGLSSGGLDSILAALILRDQGIHVEWVSFETPFFSSIKAQKASISTDIPITVKRITDIYLKMLRNPAIGYGKNMNPCLDCHALMFQLAGDIMKEKGFDFLFSGEVMGQRPMSQTRPSLRYVEKNSNFEGYILRPLSAKRLPVTIPELQGMVDREKLLDITGRSRKIQINLANKYNIPDYPAPAGGCRLTDKGFSIRLKDLFDNQPRQMERDFELLKYGRHFRINENIKFIVGRDQNDNENIEANYVPEQDILIDVLDYPSPLTLIPYGAGSEKDIIEKAGSICAGYTKAPLDELIKIIAKSQNRIKELRVKIDKDSKFKKYLL